VARLDVAGLSALASARSIRVFEPYEAREVEFRALPLNDVLDQVFDAAWRSQEELLFTCSDGYQPTVPVQRALRHRAWLAFDRADEEGFSISKLESGTRRRIQLGPFYLIWENLRDAEVRSEGDYGWPYQLVGIDLILTSDRFPKMVPPADAMPAAVLGFAAFRVHCSRCHAINGEGGMIGPDLNIPRSIVEYRPIAQIKAFIRDPQSFRYTTMPPHPHLADSQLDELVAYFTAMRDLKHDPRAR